MSNLKTNYNIDVICDTINITCFFIIYQKYYHFKILRTLNINTLFKSKICNCFVCKWNTHPTLTRTSRLVKVLFNLHIVVRQKKWMKISASSQFMNEWMKSPIGWKTREKKRKAKARSWTSRPFPNLAKLPSSEARYREREREREREMCGSDGTPTATVTANSRGAPLRFGDGELGWALTLSALQKISYSFLTSNLLTYLPTKSLHRYLGAMAVPRSSPHLHRHRPHLRAFAQGIYLTSAARSRDHEEGSSKAEKELHSLPKLWQN
jgi:hypothetical protein